MNLFRKIFLVLLVLFTCTKFYAQHHSKMKVEVNMEQKTLNIQQEIIFFNQTEDSLSTIVLNDWNNAYSSKTTPLAQRFSDEFYRGFHLATDEERASTNINSISVSDTILNWERSDENPDYILIHLDKKLNPNQKIHLKLRYVVKVPDAKFTHYGFTFDGGMSLKNWFLTPARYENHAFAKYNNLNLDDSANGTSDFDIELLLPKNFEITTDLKSNLLKEDDTSKSYHLTDENRTDFSLYIEPKSSFKSYKNSSVEVLTNLKGYKADEIKKAIAIDRIVNFTQNLIGEYHYEKITVSQADYDRNPFYGLNQMPVFLVPFPDDFQFEIKFMKTYLNNYLLNNLKLDPRKDNWIYDGIQVYAMMRYIDEFYPNCKMTGNISKYKLFKSFHLINLDFNEQYSYFYLLMARKNLDQAIGDSKDTFIKFNEQIALKYRAGLSFKYLESYLDAPFVSENIKQFQTLNENKQTSRADFETQLKSNSPKNIDWFFNTLIDTRNSIDYKYKNVSKTKESVSFSLKNKTKTAVPMPVYGIKNDSIVFKKWIEPTKNDSLYTFEREGAENLVINFKNEVPEFNRRNNWFKLNSFFPNNKPVKFTFYKDLEDPKYNQIIYTPIFAYNVYDGFSPGVRLHNRTILNRPFVYDITPTYALKSKQFTGSGALILNQDFRNGTDLFKIKYSVSGNYFNYAPDAAYFKLNPMMILYFRKDDFRDNNNQLLLLRQVVINREKSQYVADNSLQDYSVFNMRYIKSKIEMAKHLSFVGDVQFSSEFGKVSTEMQFRKLFNNNRQLNLRMYLGSFLYNTTNSDYYSFALDRPTDYLFDYAYLGRSSSTGLVSQEFIMAEGGFKSKLNTPYANQWITSLNGSYALWNWIEAYGDIGWMKNSTQKEQFLYDSGIRFNFLADYFELYFPVYSSNGWEIAEPHYNEKIRFVITLNPDKFLLLFTRKWF